MAAVDLHAMVSAMRVHRARVGKASSLSTAGLGEPTPLPAFLPVEAPQAAESLPVDEFYAMGLGHNTKEHLHPDEVVTTSSMITEEEEEDLVKVSHIPGQINLSWREQHRWKLSAKHPTLDAMVHDKNAPVDFEEFVATGEAPMEEQEELEFVPSLPTNPVRPTAAPPVREEVSSIVLDVQLPPPKVARAPMSTQEQYLKTWFDESNVMAKDAIDVAFDGEPYEWVAGAQHLEGGHSIELSQERMHEIGIVFKDGATPVSKEPARLYWIQDKPAQYKDKFGVWDPVGAQWRIFPQRTVVAIEQRIAPAGVYDDASFKGTDYGDESLYTGTALAPGLPHILSQIQSLPAGTQIPVGSGWGKSPDKLTSFYTPQLRHVQIDESIPEAAGKKYVYGFHVGKPVKPVEGKATWNVTNACWVYQLDATGAHLPSGKCCDDCCSEGARDGQLGK